MDTFLKITAGVFITLILSIVVARTNKDISVLIIILACSAISIAAITFFQPVIDLIGKLQIIGNLDAKLLRILLKCSAIGLISEIAGSICEDNGYAALSKSLKFLATAVILCIAVPVFNGLLEIIQGILVTL